MNKLSDNAYRLSLNSIIIGSEGDIYKGRSSLKNAPNVITFDRSIVQDENVLTIETHATYKSGLKSEYIYITDDIFGRKISFELSLFADKLVSSGIGFCFLPLF